MCHILSSAFRRCSLQILRLLVPAARADNSDVILEVKAGVGGQEAMLFTSDIMKMYAGYAASQGWLLETLTYDTAEQGTARQCGRRRWTG